MAELDDREDCPNVSRCELFPAMHSQARLRLYLDRYCMGDFPSCARYQFAKANKRKPPLALLPSGEQDPQLEQQGK